MVNDSTWQSQRDAGDDEGACEQRYPLELENVGEDTYILMSRGHHDPHEFMRRVRESGYDWPLGVPAHHWVKSVPAGEQSRRCRYVIVEEGTRGAFPATYAREAYGHDCYEAKTARPSAPPGAATRHASATRAGA